MCGIAGAVWNRPTAEVDQHGLQGMVDRLAHRGPDDHGLFLRPYSAQPGFDPVPGVALGHRRLAILDRAGGAQPMSNAVGDLTVVFNGEIYNFPELRRRLEGSGHRFRTRCDTEVLLYLYADCGPSFVEHLWGMFSLALWDGRRGRLTLARDRMGKKPLFFRLEADRLTFASELKSLLALPNAPRAINPQALDEYLTYQYIPHPHCILENYAKLPPAHYAVYQRGELHLTRYWTPAAESFDPRPESELRDELRELLTDAVRRRLQSDVPVGAFLSGGLDSTIVAGLAARETQTPLHTFSVGFREPDFDESSFALQAAEKSGAQHHPLTLDAPSWSAVERLAHTYDEPFADSSALPTFLLAAHAREQVTVALTGDGGDELFLGYHRYRAAALAGWFDRGPGWLRGLLSHSLWRRLPGQRPRSLLRRAKRFSLALSLPPARRYLEWMSVFSEEQRARLYEGSWIACIPPRDPAWFMLQSFASPGPWSGDPASSAARADIDSYIPCDLMTKVDLASMAHGLECRCPFLDHRLIEFALRLPPRLKRRGRIGKKILRETFTDLLPDSIARRPKMGFGIPLDDWFRGPWREPLNDLLRSSTLSDWFRPQEIARLLDEHHSSARSHGPQLWSLAMLSLWRRAWLDPPASSQDPPRPFDELQVGML